MIWLLLLLPVTLWGQRAAHTSPNTDARISALVMRLKASPGDQALRIDLAGAFLQKMRETADGSYLERASKLVEETLKQHPQDWDARRRRLEIMMMLHQFAQVIESGRKLLGERAGDPVVLGLVGDASMERGDYDQAADFYQKMGDIRPSLASYNRIAFYRFVTGDAAGAIEAMQLAIRVGSPQPENVAWCLSELGMMQFKTGKVTEAERSFREALARFPEQHSAYGGLGRVAASRGDYPQAITALLQAQQRAPFPEYAGLLAKVYRKAGQSEKAKQQLALLDLADRLGKASGEAANRHLALAYSNLDYRPARALELARAELTARQDVYSYDSLAWALFRNGQDAEAGENIEKALAQNSPEPSFHRHAAEIYRRLGKDTEAQANLRKAAALNANYELE